MPKGYVKNVLKCKLEDGTPLLDCFVNELPIFANLTFLPDAMCPLMVSSVIFCNNLCPWLVGKFHNEIFSIISFPLSQHFD